ncbi:hypothetical protein BZG79_14595 [Salinivibrio sp. MA427]|uniref:hypothetical protein n=1 Tax=Salinivibrio sp. MA427 TaxID=1909455 RepID=UPI00098A8DC2|nr:hypothetical protein [Salinivibrio sp. MA427]OOF02585.1 hypothetical protein BZG79_14595 [Salinivibrio sp. MA427]
MFEFGKEEPIANNAALYEKKRGSDELVSDQSKGRVLNRYSFVSKDCSSDSVSMLICELLNQIDLKAVVVVSWLVNLPGRSQVAAKVIEKRYLKSGWKTSVRNDHYLAFKELKLSEIDSWPPLGVQPSDGGVLLLLGNENEDTLLNALDEEHSSFLARTRYFVPDNKFFKQLEAGNVSVLYQVNDQLNNTGIVLLGKQSISMTSAENVDIVTTYEGDSAYKVFV